MNTRNVSCAAISLLHPGWTGNGPNTWSRLKRLVLLVLVLADVVVVPVKLSVCTMKTKTRMMLTVWELSLLLAEDADEPRAVVAVLSCEVNAHGFFFPFGVFWEHLTFELDARRYSTLLAQDR